jgi:hypothetical protein
MMPHFFQLFNFILEYVHNKSSVYTKEVVI